MNKMDIIGIVENKEISLYKMGFNINANRYKLNLKHVADS